MSSMSSNIDNVRNIDNNIKMKTLKAILSLPPYLYIVKHLHILKEQQVSKDKFPGYNTLVKSIYNRFSKELDKNINEKLRIIEIEKELIKVVENTDNNIFYRKLFFPSIFINNEFKFENWIIKGILVEEVFTRLHEDNNNKTYICSKDDDKFNDYIIFLSAIDPGTLKYWNISFSLTNRNMNPAINIDMGSDKKQKYRVQEYISNIVCNMVDMVEGNEKELECAVIKTTEKDNEKRIKKGKIPFPTKIYIRAKGDFKKYIHEFNNSYGDAEKSKLSYKFLVRGHWMHFMAERYVNKKGKRKWVKPYWKGQGIVISKDYLLHN